MDSKLLLCATLLLVFTGIISFYPVECVPSMRTPQQIAAHRHRVNQMIEAAEKEELLAIEWLMEDFSEEEKEQWAKENPEQAERFEKLSKKYPTYL